MRRGDREVVREVRSRDEGLDEYSQEVNSGIPMAPPVGYVKQPSMIDIVRQQIRGEHLRLQALQAGMETFEESDDFDVDDDYDPRTPFEEVFDPVEYEVRNRLRQDEYAASVEARLNEVRVAKEAKDGRFDTKQSGSADVKVGSAEPRTISESDAGSVKAPADTGGSR